MIIDILSDLHIDFYFRKKPTAEKVELVYSKIFTDNQQRNVGDALIVAGDIGHNNRQNIQVLELIKEVFGYKHIICVLGNHDYYLLDNASRGNYSRESTFRAERMRDLIHKHEGMYCLNGEVIEIDGIKIGGCDSWYDGRYIKEHFGDKCSMWNIPKDDYYINQLWKNSLNDSNYIYGMKWQEYAEQEKEKIEKIYKDVDVMVTHVNPSIIKEHTSSFYREEETTGFFTFDGSKYLKDGSMKYWIFGHTHTKAEFEANGIKCICNPMGYPMEAVGTAKAMVIKSIAI